MFILFCFIKCNVVLKVDLMITGLKKSNKTNKILKLETMTTNVLSYHSIVVLQ